MDAVVSMLDVDGRVIVSPEREPLVDPEVDADFDGVAGRLIERFRKHAAAVPMDAAYGHDDHALAVAMAEWYQLALKESQGYRAGPELARENSRLRSQLFDAKSDLASLDVLREQLHGVNMRVLALNSQVEAAHEGLAQARRQGFDQGAAAMQDCVAKVLEMYGEDDFAVIVRALEIGPARESSEDAEQAPGATRPDARGASHG